MEQESKAPRSTKEQQKKNQKKKGRISKTDDDGDTSETVLESQLSESTTASPMPTLNTYQQLDGYATQIKALQDKFVGRELIGKNTQAMVEIIANNRGAFKQRTAPMANELKTATGAINSVKTKINSVKTAVAKELKAAGLIDGPNSKKRMDGAKLAQQYLQTVCDIAISELDTFAKENGDDKYYALKTTKDSLATIPQLLANRLIFWAQRAMAMKKRKAQVDIGGLDAGGEEAVLKTFNKGVKKDPDDSLSTVLDDFAGLQKKSAGDSIQRVKPQSNFNSNWHTKVIGLTFPYNVTSGIPSSIRLGISVLCALKRYPLAAINGLTFYSLGLVFDPKKNVTVEINGFYKWCVGKKGIRANKVVKYELFNDMPSSVFSQMAIIAVN